MKSIFGNKIFEGSRSPFGTNTQRFWRPLELSKNILISKTSYKDTKKLEEEPQKLPGMDIKNFPTRSYSFGVSRHSAKKVHVQKVYYLAEIGKAHPGPGHYNPKALIGTETPKYSLSAKNKQPDRNIKFLK